MAMTPRSGLAYFWVSWITNQLAGEAFCEYAPWVKSHFKYDKSPSDFVLSAWQVEHTALVKQTRKLLAADGWEVTVEHQNAFKLTGKTAILSGKPDVIARKGDRIRIIDCKTGQPGHRDWVQVCIYMLAIPLVWERSNLVIEGEVAYKTHAVAIDPTDPRQIRDRLFALLRKLGVGPQPEATPSEFECARCDIADCTFRWKTVTVPMDPVTSEALF